MKIRSLILSSAFLAATATLSAQAAEVHVPLSELNFDTHSLILGSEFPSGAFSAYTGTTYDIPTSGNNAWGSTFDSGSNPRTMTLTPHVYGVSEVHSLINTFWGNSDSQARIDFTGSGGSSFSVWLTGDVDVRDYFYNTYANNINGTTTQNAFMYGEGVFGTVRLDEVTVTLPSTFSDEYLETIVYNDFGAENVQRIFVAGVTLDADLDVAAVPEPTTMVGGALLAGLFARRVLRRK